MNVNELVAIDVHTHAEEPCGTHPDDGYDDLQAAMAVYFNQPNNRPTIEETARYYRERKIGAVIFPVDAERETGYRRYANEEVAEKARRQQRRADPVRQHRPGEGQGGCPRSAPPHPRVRRPRLQVSSLRCRDSFRTTAAPTSSTRRSPRRGLPALFHTGQTGVGSGMRGGAGIRLKYSNPMLHRRRRRRFSRHADHPRASVLSLAGGGAVGRAAQAERLHRPVRLVAEILSADPRAATRTRCCGTRCCSARTGR